MIVKYIVFSNIISVVSDNILRICIQEPLLISKTFCIDPGPCQKNPITKKKCHTKLLALLLGENCTEIKA